ncbi:hypothetical protein HNR65_002995 [Desulfosalsimonas propionicica]|uniref:RCK C-terminal domain-containing protein n=1 Tax=Desulfosalsimonas propionicica TaxID=332175 RepID=A0A7W0CBD6_9BACT|nr:TrkA C-terminal domain-containing protein [Desulfosalsimonas propionicica]MBA2882641.1 hypothetical protein [Desulfosalsimonas propionicica]
MIAIVSLLVIVFFSILITRVATIALTHTGLSRQAARFQARSAFTGAGFTTKESEMVVGHPIRRKIVLLLMLLGNAGIVTAMSSLILSFVQQNGGGAGLALKIVLLITGLVALWALAASPWVDRRLSKIIDKSLKRFTTLDVRDYASLLHLAGDYRLAELLVNPEDWLAGKTMIEARLKDEGVIVLGIERNDGTFTGIPEGQTKIRAGDVLVLYGRTGSLQDLDERRKGIQGDIRHHQATIDQEEAEKKEDPENTGNKNNSA